MMEGNLRGSDKRFWHKPTSQLVFQVHKAWKQEGTHDIVVR